MVGKTGGQGGMALAAFVVVVALLGLAWTVGGALTSHPVARVDRDLETARALAEAKRALLSRAVVPPPSGTEPPGLLPFPDRHRDGNYDGFGDCGTRGLHPGHLLGRLPLRGDVPPCPRAPLGIDSRDGYGERLWYAVSRNVLARGRGGPVNSLMGDPSRAAHPWIRLRDGRGRLLTAAGGRRPLPLAALIIAPGPAIGDQDRRGISGPRDYLERLRVGGITVDNADADGCPDAGPAPCVGEEFVRHPGTRIAGFNDRLVAITVPELVRAVEKRVLGEAAAALAAFRRTMGAYPWLEAFPGPAGARSRRGRLRVHARDQVFATRLSVHWRLRKPTPPTVTSFGHNPALVPPLADLLVGRIRVSERHGRCIWREAIRADCVATATVGTHHRKDLGIDVVRSVDLALWTTDPAPRIRPPTPTDVRRRTLVVDTATPRRHQLAAGTITITDRDGADFGRRELRLDLDTIGVLSLGDIRFDLGVRYDGRADGRDELPEWLVTNGWHELLFVAFSADRVAGGDADGDGDCRTPVDECLVVASGRRATRAGALLIAPGVALPGQDRRIGDCDGDGAADHMLCAYLEAENGDRSTRALADTFRAGLPGTDFNDQVRIIDSPPSP